MFNIAPVFKYMIYIATAFTKSYGIFLPYGQQTDSQFAPKQITRVSTMNFIFAAAASSSCFWPKQEAKIFKIVSYLGKQTLIADSESDLVMML